VAVEAAAAPGPFVIAALSVAPIAAVTADAADDRSPAVGR